MADGIRDLFSIFDSLDALPQSLNRIPSAAAPNIHPNTHTGICTYIQAWKHTYACIVCTYMYARVGLILATINRLRCAVDCDGVAATAAVADVAAADLAAATA